MKTNNLGRIAERFIESCGKIQFTEGCHRVDLMPVIGTLEHLKFDEKYALEGFTPETMGMGGETRIYAYPKGGKRPSPDDIDVHMIGGFMEREDEPLMRESNPESHVVADESPESVWEFHLLTEMWRFLPLWWHANYAQRKYITDADSLQSIARTDPFGFDGEEEADPDPDVIVMRSGFLSEEDSDKMLSLNGDSGLLPSVTGNENGYEISYCYWSEWGGLSRVHISAEVQEGKVCFMGAPEEERLVNYECGILF